MLQLQASLIGQPILSLQTGGTIGTTVRAIINPNNLKIEGFYCTVTGEKHQRILLTQDVREIIPQGIIVNSLESFSDPDELIRLREILDINYDIIGKPVRTVAKQRLGKVDDFAADSESLYIQKLYITRSILKSLHTGQLGVDRTQVVEITDRAIIIKDPLQPTPTKQVATHGFSPAV